MATDQATAAAPLAPIDSAAYQIPLARVADVA